MESFENPIIQDDYYIAYKQQEEKNFEVEEPLESTENLIDGPSPVKATNKKYGRPDQIGALVGSDELQTFEPGLAKKLKELMTNKEKAQQDQDYDLVVALRDALEFLRDKAREFRQCLELKSIAVEQEDYEVAKRLKFKI
jgi:hypothetical protein